MDGVQTLNDDKCSIEELTNHMPTHLKKLLIFCNKEDRGKF